MNLPKIYTVFAVTAMLLGQHTSTKAQVIQIQDPAFRQCLMDSIPQVLDGNNDLIIDSAKKYTGVLNCRGRGISNADEVIHFKKVPTLILGNNNLTELPDLTPMDSLFDLRVDTNQLVVLPPVNKNKIGAVLAQFNNLNNIESLHGSPTLFSLIISANFLTFEDMLPFDYLGVGLIYGPQKWPDPAPELSVNVFEGDDYEFPLFDDTVTTNTFYLYKWQGAFYTAIDTLVGPGSFIMENLTMADAGMYKAAAYNSIMGGAIPETRPRVIVVVEDEETFFTPNGDLNGDELFLDYDSEISIYNRAGTLITRFQGPGSWNGADQSGNIVPTGAYLMYTANGDKKTISVIK